MAKIRTLFFILSLLALLLVACDSSGESGEDFVAPEQPQFVLVGEQGSATGNFSNVCWPEGFGNLRCELSFPDEAQFLALLQAESGDTIALNTTTGVAPDTVNIRIFNQENDVVQETSFSADQLPQFELDVQATGQYRIELDAFYSDLAQTDAVVSAVFGLDVGGVSIAADPTTEPAEVDPTETVGVAATATPMATDVVEPTASPTSEPTEAEPTEELASPTFTAIITDEPTTTLVPTETLAPTVEPTIAPTIEPTDMALTEETPETVEPTETATPGVPGAVAINAAGASGVASTEPTATVEPTAVAEATDAPTATAQAEVTATGVPTQVVITEESTTLLSATDEPIATDAATEAPTLAPTLTPTFTATSTPSITPSPTITPTDMPTNTPQPTFTPTIDPNLPTATVTPFGGTDGSETETPDAAASDPTSDDLGAPSVVLLAGGVEFRPLGGQFCTDASDDTTCEVFATGEEDPMIPEVMTGSRVSLQVDSDERPARFTVELRSRRGLETVLAIEQSDRRLLVFDVDVPSGSYILEVEVVWQDIRATYAYQLIVRN